MPHPLYPDIQGSVDGSAVIAWQPHAMTREPARSKGLQFTHLPPPLSLSHAGHSPETLAFNFEALCGLVPPARAPALIVAHPALLVSSPFTLWAHLDALSKLMGCDAAGAARLAGRHPRLLTASTRALRSRWVGATGCGGRALPSRAA